MINQRNLGLTISMLIFVFGLFACGLGGDSEPAQIQPEAEATTESEATNELAEPTQVTIDPTEIIVDQPTIEQTPDSSEPTTEATPTVETTPEKPAPENSVYVKTVNGYRDDLGYLHVVGLVTNNTDQPVNNLEVEVNIADSNGNTLLVEITTTSLYTLAPGETSPFSYWVSEDVSNADRYSASIVGQSTAEIDRATLKIEGVMLTIDDLGDLHLTGKLVNNTVNPVQIESLAAATFDENGNLYTADSHLVIVRHLDPGEDCPFRVTMTGPTDMTSNIEEYEIYLDAINADPIEIFDFTTSDSHYYYFDAFDSFHLVGEVTNNNDEFFTISLVAGIYDAEGNVVDAATTDIPTFSIAPGETLPYDFQYWGPVDYKTGAIDLGSNYYVQWDPFWTWASSSQYVDLTTQNDINTVDESQVTFTGEILNDSGDEIDSATVIVSLYDSQNGILVATGYGAIYEPINPNASAAYEVWIDIPADFDFSTVEYTIAAKGDLP
jgi:hypothetical protein